MLSSEKVPKQKTLLPDLVSSQASKTNVNPTNKADVDNNNNNKNDGGTDNL